MNNRKGKINISKFENIASVLGKSPATVVKLKSPAIPNLRSSDLPPDDLPPTCPTDIEILGQDGCLIINRLGNRLKEFINAGESLSSKCEKIPVLLENRLSNLGKQKVILLPDNGVALTIFIQHVITSVRILYELNNPFPAIKSKFDTQLSYADVLFCFNMLGNSIVNPALNYEFKLRAIQCTLLTLAYGKLNKSILEVSDIQDELISPLQRLTRLDLFANETIKDLTLLRDSNVLDELNKKVINNIINNLNDLEHRSKMIGNAVDTMLSAIELVEKYNPACQKYSDKAVLMLEFVVSFVSDLVPYIMEQPINDKNEYSDNIMHIIDSEFTTPLYTKFISFSDYLYFDLKMILKKTKLNSNYPKVIDKLIDVDLFKIHEDITLAENEKFHNMKEKIIQTYNIFKNTLKNSYFYKKDCLEGDLYEFSRDMNRYLPPPFMSNHRNTR